MSLKKFNPCITQASETTGCFMRFLLLPVFMLFLHTTAFSQAPEVHDAGFLQQIKMNQSDTVYVINFWATWCKPCLEELPAFQKLDSLYKNRKVKVILFSLDSKKQIQEKLIPFLKAHNISCTVYITDAVEFNKHISEVSSGWSGAIPATLISGKTKASKLFFEKTFTFEELEQIVEPLIAKP